MATSADLPSPAGLGPSPARGPGEERTAATSVSRHRTVRVAWVAVGFVAVGMGGVGVVVPGLPTTVFFVVAAWAFSRSSPRFERWVLDLPGVGRLVRDHRDGLGMPRRAKVIACSMIVVACTLSATFGFSTWIPRAAIAVAGAIGVAWILLRVPTREAVLAERDRRMPDRRVSDTP